VADGTPRAGWDGAWQPAPASLDAFARLQPGEAVIVVKRNHDGTEVTRYPATVVDSGAPAPWLELIATWVIPDVEVAGLSFVPGDTLREFFSPAHPYNAFAVFAPGGALRGWYGNVTYPAFLDEVDGETVLVWQDLYLDVVILPDGTTHLLDDDELEESGLPERDPEFAAAIVATRNDLIEAIATELRLT
jgi:hypothetical protein